MKKLQPFNLRWEEAMVRVGKVRDGLGMLVDEEIRDTIAALWLAGLNTQGSCAGHVGRGCCGPWVDICGVNKPEYRWQGELTFERRALRKLGAKKEQIMAGKQFDKEVWRAFVHLRSGWINQERRLDLVVYTRYLEQVLRDFLKLSAWIDEFNAEHTTAQRKVVLGYPGRSGGMRLEVVDQWILRDTEMNMRDLRQKKVEVDGGRAERLAARRLMMDGFTQFLIEKIKK